jgi:hypothetical protein
MPADLPVAMTRRHRVILGVILAIALAPSIRAVWPARGLAFVELDVIREAGGSGGQEVIHVSVAGR